MANAEEYVQGVGDSETCPGCHDTLVLLLNNSVRSRYAMLLIEEFHQAGSGQRFYVLRGL